jgi:hypothetical protein
MLEHTARKYRNFVSQKPSKIRIFVGRPMKIGRRNKIDENERIFVGPMKIKLFSSASEAEKLCNVFSSAHPADENTIYIFVGSTGR